MDRPLTYVSAGEIIKWRADVDASDDVGPDERIRALADIAIINVLSLLVAVLVFFVGVALAGILMMWLTPIIDGNGLAFVSALLGVSLSMSLPVASMQLGRRLQRRRLRRALRIATSRRNVLVGNVGANGAPVAVSAALFTQR